MAKSNTQQNQQNIYNFILITLINRHRNTYKCLENWKYKEDIHFDLTFKSDI